MNGRLHLFQKGHLVTFFAGLQWLGFMFANTVVIPLSVGNAFHLSSEQISGAMSRSFILTGIACLLQIVFGHRLPLMEGQSGLWWGFILSLCSLGASTGMPLTEIGGSLGAGMILGGILISVSGLLGLHKWLNRLFSPIVMAVLLILLAAQLIDIFFKGMTGIQADGHIHPGIAILSILLVVLVSCLTVAGRGLISNFSILIGIVVGWVVYVWIFGSPSAPVIPKWQAILHPFDWGTIAFQPGILIATIVSAFINTTNTIATLRAAEFVFETPVSASEYRRSFLLTGMYTAASGVFSLVAYAPYTSSIGFLRTTRLLAKSPYIVGGILFTILGLIPPLAGFFATLPISIGDAVLFVAYMQLFGSALQNIEGVTFNFRTIFRIAVPILTGLAIQSTPATAFETLPKLLQSIASNGMLIGILLSVLLENAVPWEWLEKRGKENPAAK
ncbi:uracil/xanthine transporter [Fodinisporobacter ferrooxydans]|uniref:Uracil/xanthine transporter n=1 Tax=Fodinisporobacter ferrooxydans TaxID=2901836 RepID=A0ABY4CFG9_9BACL|nr:uracil/xanthine transporter [Alicyclobacillaceae bacterium MYW30-H2]